jgi:3-methyl-2-oxobutanoate hydroxymethyltransferase
VAVAVEGGGEDVGLTPQSIHQFGGFKVQGKSERARHAIVQDALALEDAGAYAIVLEGMPADLAAEITERVDIPTIGIGAGKDCDGQVLVIQDLLGMNPNFQPKFVKQFANLSSIITEAVKSYADDVRDGKFPTLEHSF